MSMTRLWSKEDDVYLREHFPDRKNTYQFLAEHLGRSVNGIKQRACNLGIKRVFKRIIPEQGLRYGSLVVLHMVKKQGSREAYWLCKCDCGKEKVARGQSLRKGRTRSCGCKAGFKKKPLKEVTLNALYAQYVCSARKRKIKFALPKFEFIAIISNPCFYCGIQPSARYYAKDTGKTVPIYVHGIDRRNSDLGYVAGNCVPCCADCNRAKLCMTPEEFMCWIDRVAKHNGYIRPPDYQARCARLQTDMEYVSKG